MNTYLKSVVSDETGVPGASIAVQTYGDFLNFNPHLHAITTDTKFMFISLSFENSTKRFIN
jgi:hypothetical protein